MKKFIKSVDRYVKDMDATDMALMKFSACSAGMLAGLSIPKSKKVPVAIGVTAVFAAASVPLVVKFVKVLTK